MRRPTALALVAVAAAVAAGVLVLGPGAAEEEPAAAPPETAPAADPEEEGPAPTARTVDVPALRPSRGATAAAPPVLGAAFVGVVYDLGGGPHGTAAFEGATVEVRDASTLFEERLARDTLRGLDFVASSRRPPAGVATSIADAAPTHVVRTGEDGRFRVEGVRPGRWTSVRVVADGCVPVEHARVFPAPGEVRDLGRLDLLRAGVVAGLVLDEHDRPVAGADVLLGEDVATTSGEDGLFEVGGLRSGVVSLRARREGELASLAPTVVVTARTNGRIEGVRLRLPIGVELSGRVTDPNGAPIARAAVVARLEGLAAPGTISEAAVETGADGRFVLRGLPAGTAPDVEVVHPIAPPVAIEAVDPSRPLDVTLERLPWLLVRVVEAGTGNPLEPDLASWHVDDPDDPRDRPVFLGADLLSRLRVRGSTYAFPIARRGLASLTVSAPAHATASFDEPLHVDGERDAGPVTLELATPTPIVGQVVSAGGAPIRGARVVHADDAGRFVAATSTRKDGRFLIPREADGGALVAVADGYARAREERLLGPVLFVLVEEQRIHGTVIGLDGRPAADLGLLIRGPLDLFTNRDAFVTRVRTDGDGEYRVGHLADGRHRVHVQACGGLGQGEEVFARGDVRLDLDLRLTHGTLRGEVFVDDLPADAAVVRIRRPGSSDSLEVSTAAGGAYRFPILPAASYVAQARRDGRPLGAPVAFAVPPGGHVELPIVVLTARLFGTATGLAGAPAVVRIRSWGSDGDALEDEVLTDAQGKYEFVDLAPGAYHLSAHAPGRIAPPTPLHIDPGARGPVTVPLREAATLTLALPDDGPWTVGHVTLTPKGAAPYSPQHDLRTNGDLVLAQVPVGEATLDVELRRKPGEGRWRRIEREFEVEVKSGGSRLEIGE